MELTEEERKFYDTEIKKRLEDKEEAERQYNLVRWPYTLTEKERKKFGISLSYKDIDPKDYMPSKRYFTGWDPLYFPYAEIKSFMLKDFTQKEIEEFDFEPYAHYHWYGFTRYRHANPDNPVNRLWEAEHKKYSLEYIAKTVGIFYFELLDSLPYTLLILGTKNNKYDVPNVEHGTVFAWNWYYPINFYECKMLVKEAMVKPPDEVFEQHFGRKCDLERMTSCLCPEALLVAEEIRTRTQEFAYDILRFGQAYARKESYNPLYENENADEIEIRQFYIPLAERKKFILKWRENNN